MTIYETIAQARQEYRPARDNLTDDIAAQIEHNNRVIETERVHTMPAQAT